MQWRAPPKRAANPYIADPPWAFLGARHWGIRGTSSVTTQPGGKQHLYHREMRGEDVSGRFDYLFEPLEVDESAGDGDEIAPRTLAEPDDRGRWSSRMVLAGVVLATLAAAAGTAIVLLQPAQPAREIIIPSGSTPPVASTPAPTTTAETVPVLPATVSAPAVLPSSAIPTIAPPQSPQPQPTTVASEPPATMPPPPTTRAPISVSPESRAPFPNQTPPRRNDEGGGLLGGLL
jgi:hypothetical protein